MILSEIRKRNGAYFKQNTNLKKMLISKKVKLITKILSRNITVFTGNSITTIQLIC